MKGLKDQKGKFVKNIPITKECLYCLKNFSPRLNSQKFCSHKCKGASYKKNRDRNCVVCNKLFSAKSLATRFCSQECYTKNGRVPKGNKNKWWKGGITAVSQVIRTSSRNKKYIQTILARDNYTCKDCGDFKSELNVHHIIPFSLILEKIRIESGVDNVIEESMKDSCLLWDLGNAITLCIACHKKTDTYLNNKIKQNGI